MGYINLYAEEKQDFVWEFFKESNPMTRTVMFDIYEKYICEFELNKGKMLKFFNDEEIEEILKQNKVKSKTVRKTVVNFMNGYRKWHKKYNDVGVLYGEIDANKLKKILSFDPVYNKEFYMALKSTISMIDNNCPPIKDKNCKIGCLKCWVGYCQDKIKELEE
jgi:hypothetical protein